MHTNIPARNKNVFEYVIDKIKKYIELISNRLKGNLFRSFAYILSTKVIGYCLTFVCGIIIARKLGPEGRGVLTAALVIPTFISSFCTFCMPVSNVYFLIKNRDKETLFINSVYFILVSSFATIIILGVAMPLLRENYYAGLKPSYLAYVTLSAIFLIICKDFLSEFLRGLERFRELSYATIMLPGTNLSFLLLFFYVYGLNVEQAVLAALLAMIAPNVYKYVLIRKRIPLKLEKANFGQFKENFSYGLKEYLGRLLSKMNYQIDILVLAAFIDRKLLGIYSVAIGLSRLFRFIPRSTSYVLLPTLAKLSDQKSDAVIKKWVFSNITVLGLGYIGYIIVGKWLIVLFYGKEFADAYLISIIIIFGTICLGSVEIINKYFSGIGRPEIKSLTRAINLPIKGISMFFLIKYYSLIGAAFSFVISAGSLLLITFCYYRKIRDSLTKDDLTEKLKAEGLKENSIYGDEIL